MPSVIVTDNLAAYADYLNGREYGANGWADTTTVNRSAAGTLLVNLTTDSAAFLSDYNLDNPSLVVIRTFDGLGNPDDLNFWADGISINRGPPAFLFVPLADNLANYNDALAISIPQLTLRLAADNLANYGDSVATTSAGLSLLLTDNLFAYGEQLKMFYTMRLVLPSDALNAYLDQVARTETATDTFGNWITEELFGAHDGVNTDFVISHTPIVESMSVFHNGFRLVRVAGAPNSGEAQYGISGTTVKLGKAPKIGEWVQTRYFTDD